MASSENQPPRYIPPPPTKEILDYADLAIIDLSKAETSGGRVELTRQVCDAIRDQGFFYVINHGYSAAQTQNIFDIADIPFSLVDDDEKRTYVGRMKETGSYQGYKPRGYNIIDAGVYDQVEHYNINPDVSRRQHPKALRPFMPEIHSFARHFHFNVLLPILRMLAIGLELPENALTKYHNFGGNSETWIRFMKYYPRSSEEEIKTKNVWFKGHTDLGSITILYSQPVAGLQILSKDGSWKWVKHMENALVLHRYQLPVAGLSPSSRSKYFRQVINTGDSLEFFSGGFYRPTIHRLQKSFLGRDAFLTGKISRVVQPPVDQRNCTRLGVFYFCVPDDDIELRPLTDSPVLQRLGAVTERFTNGNIPTTEIWRKARISAYGQTELKPAAEDGVQEEIVGGVLMRHYS